MAARKSPGARLRELLARPGILTLPGAYDCIGSRLIASEGFDAFYMTGAGTAASRTGRPDVGLITMSEMADNAARMAGAVDIPLIADCDTGYGNVLNMMRTVEMFERAGVAGIQIEDQVFPKKCGHYEGKQIVPASEMVQKIKVAVDTRRDSELVVVARTDAIAVTSFEDALERARLYDEAGADVLFIEAPRTMEQLKTIGQSFTKPLLYNMAISGKTPFLAAAEMEALGFKIALFAGTPMYMYAHAMQDLLRGLKKGVNLETYKNRMLTFKDYWNLMGMEEIIRIEEKYGKAC